MLHFPLWAEDAKVTVAALFLPLEISVLKKNILTIHSGNHNIISLFMHQFGSFFPGQNNCDVSEYYFLELLLGEKYSSLVYILSEKQIPNVYLMYTPRLVNFFFP